MEAISLPTLVQEHLTIARTASSGRSAHTVFGGHDHRLRQTLIALAAGQELAEHESPGEATIHVLAGAVELTTTTDSALLAAGDVAVIPDERHGLHALEDRHRDGVALTDGGGVVLDQRQRVVERGHRRHRQQR